MSWNSPIGAVIPAAGRSSRMGQDKALCPLEGETFLARILRILRGLSVPVVVVTRPDQGDVRAAVAEEARTGGFVTLAENPLPESHMVDSVAFGVRRLVAECDGLSGVLVWPVDVPLVPLDVVEGILETFQWDPSRLVVPTWQGEPGHPVCVPVAALEPLLRDEPPLPFSFRDVVWTAPRAYVAASGPEVVENLNTMDDVRRAIGGPKGADHES